jgi:hypothetical protein
MMHRTNVLAIAALVLLRAAVGQAAPPSEHGTRDELIFKNQQLEERGVRLMDQVAKLRKQLSETTARAASSHQTEQLRETTPATPPIDKSTPATPTFILTHNRTRQDYGPFEYAQGEPILIGKTAFTLSLKQLSHVENTLSKVMLRQIDLRSAGLVNCIKFLELETKNWAPKGEVVNFVVALPRSQD